MKSAWLLRVLALAGLAISAYLLGMKLTGRIDSIAGCGEGSGCSNVLGSRWSQFFGIPVTAFSAGMYAVLLAVTWRPHRLVYAGLVACFAGAALWFYAILLFVLKDFCPWCTAAHLVGLACAVVLVVTLKKRESLPGRGVPGAVAGLAAVAVLVLGQLYGPVPDTHAESGAGIVLRDEPGAIHARGEGRVVTFFDGGKSLRVASLPHLGPPDAPMVIVKYYDFTCEACLELHRQLETVAEAHPGTLCTIVLPVPLHTACNPAYPPGNEEHPGACELARLALAGWRAQPDLYPEVHEILFTRPLLDPEIAEIAVAQIVGEETLAAARQDPWVEEVLAANCRDFGQLKEETVKMPKLLFGEGRIIHGVPKSRDVLEEELGVR